MRGPSPPNAMMPGPLPRFNLLPSPSSRNPLGLSLGVAPAFCFQISLRLFGIFLLDLLFYLRLHFSHWLDLRFRFRPSNPFRYQYRRHLLKAAGLLSCRVSVRNLRASAEADHAMRILRAISHRQSPRRGSQRRFQLRRPRSKARSGISALRSMTPWQ
jgi:hypothetical protein